MTGELSGFDAVAEARSARNVLDIHWSRICSRLQAEVGEVEYRTWLKQISIGPVDGDEITLNLPTRFLRDWVRTQYGDRLSALWNAELPAIRRVELQVGRPEGAADGAAPAPADPPVAATPATAAIVGDERVPENRNDLAAPLDPRFTFDTFVVGKPNEFAYACARRVAERPSSPGFNPLFLYGGVGLGKTHLMHAIGSELVRGGAVSVAYMSAEKFMYRFIAAIRSQSTMEFKEQLRSVDVLMIDDLQFLIGKDNTQEEFFHTFNALVDAGRQIVVSADKSPSDLSGLEDRLRTRLGCGMVADIHATTFELRISILESKAAASGVAVPAKVLEFLAHKITSNVRELEGALNRLIAHANLFGRPVTLEATQDVLHDILKAHDRRVTIEEIQRKVSEHWNIRLTDMSSARRARAVARPRQVAMYLAKQLTSRSLPEIGRKFGNRDHTTVMHAVARVTELMERDTAFAEDVELLRRMLES
ncbi:chromosomal replication initiator protein DnaA [Gluconacetobacter diazotrophicus PA1 5]|uniref:Chromosomal replication initiator protein DnaA n=1 Tax=Gluconacetobacter diazotrophicus TaxID=33996 RepID=A0A7W4FDM8_GLUDI|nr:chromosomal replication initiator protein DnaA [Gluconacetobacter diazotrophicus]ACI49803.1 chromosomal replication initiator protein DnaA [Gluconacetobacter diazotrophicus PA1 5]MBB2155871.1 chromosomal replication initiator protein DnaA [Gluconacetobacter diazotrophicus]TWB10348.1 chromosomal replication initiator protein [Gluconacetobacter diazotrophicus]